MMNKKVVLSLLAGAMLLPASAIAGVVGGACVECHTMHNSQNGSGINASTQDQLLVVAGGCAGCHAGVDNNGATGLSDGSNHPAAPQVNDATNPLNGGFFGVLGDAFQHNVADLGNSIDAAMVAVPGGTGAPVGLNNAGNPDLQCNSCHTQAGHHAPATGTVYRMLAGTNTTSKNANYGVNPGNFQTRNGNAYDSTGMNNLCAVCHGDFHGTTVAGGDGDQDGSVAGSFWARHPTDIDLVGSGPSIDTTFAGTDRVPVGADGSTTQVVMCISCHVPHGGDFADLLAFNYSAGVNAAGDTTADEGCESCHSYSGQGM